MLKMTQFAKVCLHPGIEVGSQRTGQNIEIINDLIDIRGFEVKELLHYHVSTLKICEDTQSITGIAVRLTDHRQYYAEDEDKVDRPIDLQSIGSRRNCSDFTVADNTYIKSVRVKSDDKQIKQIFIEGSDG